MLFRSGLHNSIRAFRLAGDGWELKRAYESRWSPGWRIEQAFIGRWLTIVRFTGTIQSFSSVVVILTADRIDGPNYRKLKQYVQWRARWNEAATEQ